MIFSASQACYALFSECDPHTPAWSSFTSRSPLLLLLLSGRKPQLIKTFILFPILLSQCHAGPLAISVIDISACLRQCVCARTLFCVCVWTWKEPRAKYAGCHWSAALCPPLRALLSWGVTHLYQMACGVSLSGCVQVQIFCKAPDKHFGVRGCFCLSRPQRLDVADVFFFFFGFICNCVHFPLPFVHHCGASCLCLDCLLHWRVGKIWQPIRFCQGSVQEQVPSSDYPEAAGKTECSKWQLILKEALSGF